MIKTIIVEAELENGGVNVDKTKPVCELEGHLYDPTLTNGIIIEGKKKTVLLIIDSINEFGNLIRTITLMPQN